VAIRAPARAWCFVCSPIGWRDSASWPSGLSPIRPHDLQIFIGHVDIDMTDIIPSPGSFRIQPGNANFWENSEGHMSE
jgi:hypothetical protein